MNNLSPEAVETLARKIETREPYKSPIQIACEERFSLPRDVLDKGIGDMTIILGQGDYPTVREIADGMTDDANKAATTLRALSKKVGELEAEIAEKDELITELMMESVAMQDGLTT